MKSDTIRNAKLLKNIIQTLGTLIIAGALFVQPAMAEQMSNYELTERINQLEEKLKNNALPGGWAERVSLSGVVEVEAGFEDIDYDDPAVKDEDSSDLSLATAELGVDADVADHVAGHVLFLYEDDEDVVVDEAFITISGEDVVPLYMTAGKLYVPFGNFETRFVSDPMTLDIGETRETAVTAGYADDIFDINATVFNGDVDEAGEDNHIETWSAAATFTLPENQVPGLGLAAGVSYISNIAEADGLEEEITAGEVEDHVAGAGCFLTASYMERFFFQAEYISALDDFKAGELNFDGGERFEPETWNVEFAFKVVEKMTLAARYEGGEDLGGFLPETRYGGCVTYDLFENTSIALELLNGEFENDDEAQVVTAQLAVEF
ncbi:MAG: LbtU family siderophore porin [Desulfobacteraceae bacterium]